MLAGLEGRLLAERLTRTSPSSRPIISSVSDVRAWVVIVRYTSAGHLLKVKDAKATGQVSGRCIFSCAAS